MALILLRGFAESSKEMGCFFWRVVGSVDVLRSQTFMNILPDARGGGYGRIQGREGQNIQGQHTESRGISCTEQI